MRMALDAIMARSPMFRFIVALICTAIVGFSAFGQTNGHDRYHWWYQHWKQPGTDIGCCNARITAFGAEQGDCEPTRAELRNGDWYAWERFSGQWLKIPDDRIVHERNPSSEEGHLCFNKYTKQILCFVPPDTGG
jgi:hypothetical protein